MKFEILPVVIFWGAILYTEYKKGEHSILSAVFKRPWFKKMQSLFRREKINLDESFKSSTNIQEEPIDEPSLEFSNISSIRRCQQKSLKNKRIKKRNKKHRKRQQQQEQNIFENLMESSISNIESSNHNFILESSMHSSESEPELSLDIESQKSSSNQNEIVEESVLDNYNPFYENSD